MHLTTYFASSNFSNFSNLRTRYCVIIPFSALSGVDCRSRSFSPPFSPLLPLPITNLILSFLMSTSVDARRRPSLWSYISFTSSPRRRSVSLPTRNTHDPFEKEDRHRGNGWAKAPTGTVENIKDAWMTQSQRSRYLKTGGIVAFLLLLVFLFSSSDSTGVRELVKGA